MKKTTKIFGLLLTLFGLALVTGCTPITETPDMPEEITYTVTYSSEYGTAPASITVTENTALEADQLKALEAEGFTFTGWFDEEDIKVEVGYKVTKDITLTAKWDEVTIDEPAPEDTESENPPVVDGTDDNPTTDTPETESEDDEPVEQPTEENPTGDEPTEESEEDNPEESIPEGTEESSEEESEQEEHPEESEEITYTVTFVAYNNVQPKPAKFKPGDKVELECDIYENIAYVKYSGIVENSDRTLYPELWFKAGAPVKFLRKDTDIKIENDSLLPEAISEEELKEKYKSIWVVIEDDAFGDESYELQCTSISYNNEYITIFFN